MGAGLSLEMFDPSHVRIYKSLIQIQNPRTRAEMITTLLAGSEYVQFAKTAGVYSHLLAYVARVNSGQKPAPLPGEASLLAGAQPVAQAQRQQTQLQVHGNQQTPSSQVSKGRRNEKALNYFQNCLLVLGLQEEVALTEEMLRSVYKKAAVKSHPDKGGSEQEFEAVTRAYAYLTEILHRIKGGRTKESVVEEPTVLQDSRKTEAKDWELVQPVRLNPKKLDMNTFNTMFEQTRIPDPDDQGYGDWLKGDGGAAAGPTFGGKFNRDVFNRTFEDEARKRGEPQHQLSVVSPQAMMLAPGHGVELGRKGADDFTAAANSQIKYTDLRNAYTTESTFSNQIADVHVEQRSYDAYSNSRKKAPEPLNDNELAAIEQGERMMKRNEEQRSLRAAQEMSQADEYFKRMKQLVLTDTKPLQDVSRRRY
jgi:curved DNA-binding protein CbpA